DSKAASLHEIRDAMDRSAMLVRDINDILALLLNDNRDAQLKAEKERLRQILEQLNKAIREQKNTRARTESGATDKQALTKSQEKVTKDTQEIAKAMSGDPKNSDNKSKDGKSKEGNKDDSKGKDGKGKEGDKGDKKGKQSQGDQKDGDKKGD